jgi:hypothetical protein
MGSLQRFDLRKYADLYGLSVFFETGTFRGDGVQKALQCSFEKMFSVEIVPEFFHTASARFDGSPAVTLIYSDSVTAMEKWLPTIKANTFFWLDAHFPGADGGLEEFNSGREESIRLPLESELRTIRKLRSIGDDVILIDDLRIYEAGEYDRGNLPEEIRPPAISGIEFVFELYGDTHHILRLSYDEGYLLLLPNKYPPAIFVTRMLNEFPDAKLKPDTVFSKKASNWLRRAASYLFPRK